MIKRSLLLSLLLTAGGVQAQNEGAAPDLEKAKQTAETICAGCHMADGNSMLAANPKLAGQHPTYLYKQLADFKSGQRASPIMGAMVASLNDDDMKGLAAHFSAQTLKPESARGTDTVAAGQKLWRAGDKDKGIPACAACHGPAGAGLPAQYPALSGQFAEYIETQLKAFRSGDRANDPSRMMRDIAIKMTDAEIQAVSDYAAGLRSSIK
ncbi:MAG: cytochrome c4 [Rhodocyclaceae bacterium]|nr:cytochrome c4 [Rhodocyclaceae bacterium]